MLPFSRFIIYAEFAKENAEQMWGKKGEERSEVRIHEELREFQDTSLNNWNTNRGIGAWILNLWILGDRIQRTSGRIIRKTSIERKSFELDLICGERAKEERILHAEYLLCFSYTSGIKEISSANSNSTHGAPVEPLVSLKNCMHVSQERFREILYNRPSLPIHSMHRSGCEIYTLLAVTYRNATVLGWCPIARLSRYEILSFLRECTGLSRTRSRQGQENVDVTLDSLRDPLRVLFSL